MKTLNTTIVVPNINKWKVVAFANHKDDPLPWGQVTILFQGSGITYALYTFDVYDNSPGQYVALNASPGGYYDRLSTGERLMVGAYASLVAADTSAGNRNAQLLSIEEACLTAGIVDATLAST